MLQTLKIQSLIDIKILQQVQDSFSKKYQLSILVFDADGKPLTTPSHSLPATFPVDIDMKKLIDILLRADVEDYKYALADGQPIYSSFLDKSLLRVFSPVLFQNDLIAVISLISLKEHIDPLKYESIHSILSTRGEKKDSDLALLDDITFYPSSHLMSTVERINETLQMMLDAGFQRLKYTLSHQEPGSEKDILMQELTYGIILTTKAADIIESNKLAAKSLAYDMPEEMLGLNVIEHFVLEEEHRLRIQSELAQTQQVDWFGLVLERKDGTLLETQLKIEPYKNENGEFVGYRYLLNPGEEVNSDTEQLANGATLSWSNDLELEAKEHPSLSQSLNLDKFIRPIEEEELAAIFQDSPEPIAKVPVIDSSDSRQQPSLQTVDQFNRSDTPIIILDRESRIFLWNKMVEKILGFQERSVANTPFTALLVGEDQQKWQKIASGFTINKTDDSLKLDSLKIINDSGDIIRCTVSLARDHVLGNEFFRLTFLDWKKEISESPVKEITVKKLTPGADSFSPATDHLAESPIFDREIFSLSFDCHWIIPIEDEEKFKNGHIAAPNNLHDNYSLSKNPLLEKLIYNRTSYTDKSWETFVRACLNVLKNLEISKEVTTSHYDREELEFYYLRHTVLPLQINGKIAGVHGFCINLSEYIKDRFELETVQNRLKRILQLSGMGYFRFSAKKNTVESINDAGLALLGLTSADDVNRSGLFARLLSSKDSDKQQWNDPDQNISRVIAQIQSSPNATSKLYFAWQTVDDVAGEGYYEGIFQPLQGTPKDEPAVVQIKLNGRPTENGKPASERPTILIIDDEPDIVEVMKLSLDQEGYVVHSCGTAEEALKLAEKFRSSIELVIIDLILPDMSGIKCAEKLIDILDDTPIIISSGYTRSPEANKIIEKTKGNWLQKPFNSTTLLQTVHRTLL